ncbi:hypothetical protein QBC46DRAFT_366678 [Diplogelasinospora grovesii]|uniref:3-hydroxyisobutyrate dehydrogenase n=1 Tax=Diplogelasinospora grovesii TaxID=303347 RepID=A0AAN6N3K0_9PEZI|nr:hypothetical protein QBC46DRAFT_366678 [Diplogelasinospora grovesii]
MSEVYVIVSALDAGHITLPEHLFVTNGSPENRVTVPSLSFLIQHGTTKMVFDLGVKRSLDGYTESQKLHVAQRQPVIVSPDCADSLRYGCPPQKDRMLLDPTKDVDIVILSHVHWDHVGTPTDFLPGAVFVVGSGTLELLTKGGGPLYPGHLFNDDELPGEYTVELPEVKTASKEYEQHRPKHTQQTNPDILNKLPLKGALEWREMKGLGMGIDLFGDQSVWVIDSPGHLYGHANLLCRLGEKKWVYLGGDCCHDPRILRGEKGIAMYDDGMGGLRSVHTNTHVARETLEKINGFIKGKQLDGEDGAEVEVVLAHDKAWREGNLRRFWPGLGVMGFPMAKNLRAGLDPSKLFLIRDVNTDALSRFIGTDTQMKNGPISIVDNTHDAAELADVVITMLPDSAAVKSVYLDPYIGLLQSAIRSRPSISSSSPFRRKIFMECGTIDSDTIASVSQAFQAAATKHPGLDAVFVDAPVSGGPMGAQDGTLTFMVGCPPASSSTVFPVVRSYLEHMGNKNGIYLCGDVGSGTAFKIINNYLSAITSLAASEALSIGVKAGLDPKLLTEVINASGGQCWVTSKSNPVPGVQENVPSSRGYEGGFRIELCAKVLGMGTKLAEMVGARTILDKPTLEAFGEAMQDERYKGKDARVVYKWLNESERR